MALFREITASRVGGVKGFNATTESRIVRVIMEDSDVDSGRNSLGTFEEKPDPRDLVEQQWARIGSGHPWDREGLKAGSYRIVKFMPPRAWWVEVVYYRNNVTLGIPPTNEWLIRYRGATITEQALTELPPESGGNQNDVWQRTSREVGSPAFKKLDAEGGSTPAGATHKARGVNKETGADVTVWLRKVDQLTEEPRGVNVEVPAMLVTFSRTIANVNHGRLATSLVPFLRAVNSVPFRGAPELQVKFLDVQLDPVAATVPGQTSTGVAYAINLSFLWSYDPWGPYSIQPSWYDGDGHRATVLDMDEQPLPREEFRNVRRKPFEPLLTIASRGY